MGREWLRRIRGVRFGCRRLLWAVSVCEIAGRLRVFGADEQEVQAEAAALWWDSMNAPKFVWKLSEELYGLARSESP
jgi:hypothetical protein